jgi:ketosteroid isomerase-like protein
MTSGLTIDVVRDFYEAFARRDGGAMASAYADDVRFSDPVFPELRGEHARAVWRMLCARAEDLRVSYTIVDANEEEALVRWNAWYTFRATGRPVHNVVHSTLKLRAGRIFEHVDAFDFWRWSRQALGPAGWALGWTPWIRARVRAQAGGALSAFVETAEPGR